MIKPYIDHIYKTFFKEEYLLQILCEAQIHPKQLNKKMSSQLLQQKHIDWEKMLDLIKANNLQTIILDYFQNQRLVKFLPSGIQSRLVKLAFYSHIYSLKHREQSRIILKKLINNKVEFVMMKTYALKERIFKNREIKADLDVDLLIPVHEFKEVSGLLFDLGYLFFPDMKTKNGVASIANLNFYCPSSQEIFKKGHHAVEIHTTITDTPRYSQIPVISEATNRQMTQEVYNGTDTISYQNIKVKVFKPSQLLLTHFLHSLVQHNLQRATSYYECAKMLQVYKEELEWGYIMKFVNIRKLKSYFMWFLFLLNDLYPNLLPNQLESELVNYEGSLKTQHWALYPYMKYKIFHQTNFAESKRRERQKEWCWAIIDQHLLNLVKHKIKKHLV
ncbi:MAG: hypothetical protein A2900_01250 [Candidatus Chisholmbacteria bacterium RIFCSPLOWO2_01_FULL_50_28]|uniref:Nucleotidyltransferase n=1 Tax=Candidatus Chisholmbacteria bacterium RIFCSPHIGHO2_01_FULL_52_32 TaxID=1797591 RepID=A0A1G1VUC4_9BACT|nr:MAG: hypothetical protein A2786_05490 [Candidatus Chisholmbacteria bacterium RIFCSPHIGHO2_01_FULL_52_32]OGY19715.1 MAG: hypothetical protein A2900_01250 [Candidatus Chisholmbacteria bacterium RIFCSPLOWO2_01_FULL_50_28]